jgi:hypothetical protein
MGKWTVAAGRPSIIASSLIRSSIRTVDGLGVPAVACAQGNDAVGRRLRERGLGGHGCWGGRPIWARARGKDVMYGFQSSKTVQSGARLAAAMLRVVRYASAIVEPNLKTATESKKCRADRLRLQLPEQRPHLICAGDVCWAVGLRSCRGLRPTGTESSRTKISTGRAPGP